MRADQHTYFDNTFSFQALFRFYCTSSKYPLLFTRKSPENFPQNLSKCESYTFRNESSETYGVQLLLSKGPSLKVSLQFLAGIDLDDYKFFSNPSAHSSFLLMINYFLFYDFHAKSFHRKDISDADSSHIEQ